tara:strand:- start:229 stop:336 length:108 start_codon:yes stop_codon:yes gene_type:complete
MFEVFAKVFFAAFSVALVSLGFVLIYMIDHVFDKL